MKANEFIDKLCQYARQNLAPKCTNKYTIMAIAAASCGVGRKILDAKILPILAMAVDEQGELDLAGIKDSVLSGMDLAQSVPVLGGLVSIDADDAREFFSSLGV